MPAVQAAGRIPDVVDEARGLLAVRLGAVAQDAAVGHQHRVDGDDRPGVDL